ncbi:NADH-quinone oxidoreductase subunit C [Helicovermis profundi]|uniref:NADH-quinone oxidoreductase subunit C n=2 Tax=Helicovermis profundi TaxID=3065157 RepID=A0AAU9E4T1_9FIRM|nr:NADH-quinone oxidoreductase subunit C [Clostridia bacterium S502]
MNSMNSIYENLNSKFNILSVDYPDDMQMAIDLEEKDIHTVLAYLKSDGYTQLSILTCVDWLKEGVLQLVYVIFNWDSGIHILVRTKLDRDKPLFRTVMEIYPGAEFYERDVHEFFGVEFEGNERSYKHLFLELWDAEPPMRKDFDTQAYSDKKYAPREYKSKFISEKGGEK